MRNSHRLYTVEEVASLTYKSVSIIKTYAAKLGLGRRYANRGRSFLYSQDDAVRILVHITSLAIPSKKKVRNRSVAPRKLNDKKAI